MIISTKKALQSPRIRKGKKPPHSYQKQIYDHL